LRNGLLSSAAVYAIFAFLLALVALTVKAQLPLIDPDLALIYGFAKLLPPGLLGLATVLLFSAIMSSVDTYIFTAASSVVQDFFKLDKKKAVKYIKNTLIILSIIGLIITILIQSLVIGSYIFVSFVVVLAVAVLATWIKKSVRQTTLLFGFVFGIIGLAAFLIISLLRGYIEPTIVLVALASSIVGIIIGAVISSIKNAKN
jgi:Na+/proline symporter